MSPRHCIETLELECVFDREDTAWIFQDRLSHFMHGSGQRTLQEAFDAVSHPGEVWRIDHLELDLGRLQLHDPEDVWQRRLADQLKTQLRKLALESFGMASFDGDPSTHDPQHRAQRGFHRTSRWSRVDYELHAVLHYLQWGYLPWFRRAPSGHEMSLWLERLVRHAGPRLWLALQRMNPSARMLARMEQSVPHAVLHGLLRTQHPGLAQGLEQADRQFLEPLQASGRLSAYQVRQLRQAWRMAGLQALWGQGGTLSQARMEALQQAMRDALARVMGSGGMAHLRSFMEARRPMRSKQHGTRESGVTELLIQGLWELPLASGQAPVTSDARLEVVSTPVSDLAASTRRRIPNAFDPSLFLQHALKAREHASGVQFVVAWVDAWMNGEPLLQEAWEQAPRRDWVFIQMELAYRARSRSWRLHAVRQWPQDRLLECLGLLVFHATSATSFEDRSLSVRIAREELNTWLPCFLEAEVEARMRSATEGVDSSRWTQLLWEGVLGWTASNPGQMPSPNALRIHWDWTLHEASRASGAVNTQQSPDFDSEPLNGSMVDEVAGDPEAQAISDPLDMLMHRLRQRDQMADRIAMRARLAEPGACEEWLRTHSEAERWELITHCFKARAASIKACSQNLLQAAAHLLPEVPEMAIRAQHWRFLAKHLFEEGMSTHHAEMARRYALHLSCWRPLKRRFMKGEPSRLMTSDSKIFVSNGPIRNLSLRHWQERLQQVLSPVETSSCVRAWTPKKRRSLFQSAVQMGSMLHSLLCRGAMRLGLLRPPRQADQWEAMRRKSATPTGGKDHAADAIEEILPASSILTADWDADPIPIENAGLVLLGPYLERLFTALGLTQERAFVGDVARIQAIHCLEFLARGGVDTSEPSWVLNKLICGVSIDHPIPPCEGLSEQVCETLDGLLKAVIQHWKTIGNTSVRGLQESFLSRAGRLSWRTNADSGENSWLLQVESRAFDMLLDRLPWGYSTLRLPWMEGVIHVEWR